MSQCDRIRYESGHKFFMKASQILYVFGLLNMGWESQTAVSERLEAGSLTGEFEENNSARITNRDGEESSLGGASSSEEYFYDSLEDGSNSRLSNNNTLKSKTPLEKQLTDSTKPIGLPRAISETLPSAITTRDDKESPRGGASSPEEYFYDSLEDGNNSRLSNISKLSSKTPLKKKPRASRIPIRLPRANPGTLPQKDMGRTSRRSTRGPRPTVEHLPRAYSKKPRASRIPVRVARLTQRNLPPTKRELPPIKTDRASKIPIRLSRLTSKPFPPNINGLTQDFQKSKETKKSSKPQGNNVPKSGEAPKRPHPTRKSVELSNLMKKRNPPVSTDKKHSKEKEEAPISRKLSDDQVNYEMAPYIEEIKNNPRALAKSKEVDDANMASTKESEEHDTTLHTRNVSLSPILKIPEEQEGKLSPNTLRLSLLQGMKSIVKEVEAIKNKMETFNRITNVERAEESYQQSPEKQSTPKQQVARETTTVAILGFKNKEKYEISSPESPQTDQKVSEIVKSEDRDSAAQKSTHKASDSSEVKPKASPNREKKSTPKATDSFKAKSQASTDREKQSTPKASKVKSEANKRTKKKSTPETNDSSGVKAEGTPIKAKKSTPGETVWERLAKKPSRNTRNENDKPDTTKRRNPVASVPRKQTGAETKKKVQNTQKSKTKNIKRRQKSPDGAMLANATNLFASGLRFHKNENRMDKTKRTKTKFDIAKEKYLKFLEMSDENEKIIKENQQKIERQENELDEAYEEAQKDTEKIAESTNEVVQARKVHRNFKDEATRVRVLHKTNMIAADIYEADSTILQGHITELQQEITEMKAINRLDPDELKEKIQDVLAYRDSQRDRNSELEEQIKSLRNRLNEIKCGDELPGGEAESTEETKSGAAKENETDDGMNLNEEIIDGIMVNTHDETDIVIGHSRSADVVSGNEIKPPRETKSDQNQCPIENENAPVHVRPLLHRRKSLAERLRLLMMTSDQAECPPGDSEDIVNPRQLLPLLLPSKQHPDEVMPIQGPRHPTWPRPSYANGQLPGCYIPLPPLHPRMDDGFPMVVNHLPHPSTSPRPPDRDSPTPAIQTPLPPICPRPPDGNSVTANQFPHPPLSPRSLANGRPKTAKARHVSLLSTCLASYDRKSPKPSVAFFYFLKQRQ